MHEFHMLVDGYFPCTFTSSFSQWFEPQRFYEKSVFVVFPDHLLIDIVFLFCCSVYFPAMLQFCINTASMSFHIV